LLYAVSILNSCLIYAPVLWIKLSMVSCFVQS
jgi:hypothetical protein